MAAAGEDQRRGGGASCVGRSTRACTRWTCPAAGEVTVGQGRRCEIAVVRLAGAVDEAGYLAHNQAQAERGAEPVDHFCRRGWRALRNPSLDFDVWWYWAEYLDPTDESETAANPLVHYLLDGRHRGLLPLPQRRRVAAFSLAGSPRRACLFAMYDPGGLVDDCVVAYVEELARHADVFVLADGSLEPGQLDRLSAATGAWVRAHGGHDFGSWSLLARELVGWGALAAYDEVLLANDSCWLVRPLDEVFARDGHQAGRLLGAAADRPAVRAGAVPAAVGAARGGEAVLAAADRVPLPRAGARRLLLPGAAPSGARRPRLPAPPRRGPPAARPGQPGAEVRDRHHAVPRRPGLRLLDLGARAAAQPPDLRAGRLRPARRGVPAVQAPLPGREPLRHPRPGRLEAAHPGRRPRTRRSTCSSATCSASPTRTSWPAPSRSGRRGSP